MIVGLAALGPVRSLTVHQIAYMESAGVERSVAANIVGLADGAGLLLTSVSFIALVGSPIASGASRRSRSAV